MQVRNAYGWHKASSMEEAARGGVGGSVSRCKAVAESDDIKNTAEREQCTGGRAVEVEVVVGRRGSVVEGRAIVFSERGQQCTRWCDAWGRSEQWECSKCATGNERQEQDQTKQQGRLGFGGTRQGEGQRTGSP